MTSIATADPAAPHPPVRHLTAAPAAPAGQAHWDEGLTLAQRRDWRGAARAFGRAARVSPRDSLYWLNLAHAQRHAGRLGRAVAAARRCLQIEPGHTLALRLLGDCLMQQHRHAEACEAFEALEAAADPDPEALLQHASTLIALMRFGDATRVLLAALAQAPGLARAHALLGSALRDQGLKREAVQCLLTAIALEPDNLEARAQLSFEKRHVCDWSDLDDEVGAIERLLAAPHAGAARVAAVFGLLSLPLAPELHLAAARAESLALAGGLAELPAVHRQVRAARADPRIRLGWLSYDFREHPVSQLIVELLETLDRNRFEVLLYSLGPDDGSAMRRRVVAAADRFVDLSAVGDRQAAERMRGDGVDIAIDLMGHTRGNRLAILARRPAPLQLAFLGYPGSTGAPWIDYLVGDPLVTPLELAPLYSERLAQMPLSFQPNGRWRPLPGPMSRAQAGLPEGAFVMCAFNHTYKILPAAFDAWCRVLHEVPKALLWLKETNGQLHDNVRREARVRGIDPARIVFAPTVTYETHFSRLALADVFVDTWPYNAHTTAADALWAGVPVVTLHGNGFASRVAASVLNAAGLAELAFETVDDYCGAIIALARDPGLLAGYRRHLNAQRLVLPLFDTPAYARDFEALLQRLFERWLGGLPAEHLAAEASRTVTAGA